MDMHECDILSGCISDTGIIKEAAEPFGSAASLMLGVYRIDKCFCRGPYFTIFVNPAGTGVSKFISLRVTGWANRSVCAWSASLWIGLDLAP